MHDLCIPVMTEGEPALKRYIFSDPSLKHKTNLQDDPVTFLGSDLERLLCHLLLTLAQRHIMELAIVTGVAESHAEVLHFL